MAEPLSLARSATTGKGIKRESTGGLTFDARKVLRSKSAMIGKPSVARNRPQYVIPDLVGDLFYIVLHETSCTCFFMCAFDCCSRRLRWRFQFRYGCLSYGKFFGAGSVEFRAVA